MLGALPSQAMDSNLGANIGVGGGNVLRTPAPRWGGKARKSGSFAVSRLRACSSHSAVGRTGKSSGPQNKSLDTCAEQPEWAVCRRFSDFPRIGRSELILQVSEVSEVSVVSVVSELSLEGVAITTETEIDGLDCELEMANLPPAPLPAATPSLKWLHLKMAQHNRWRRWTANLQRRDARPTGFGSSARD